MEADDCGRWWCDWNDEIMMILLTIDQRECLTCLLFSELRRSSSSDCRADVCLTSALLICGSWWLAVVSECDLAIAEAGLCMKEESPACSVALPRTLVGFTHSACHDDQG